MDTLPLRIGTGAIFAANGAQKLFGWFGGYGLDGTAGWMAANLMIKAWGDRGFDITLLESPDIGIVGVGEGSTPMLKTFMSNIGLEEKDWMPACNATYKLGIKFIDWARKDHAYWHPFGVCA